MVQLIDFLFVCFGWLVGLWPHPAACGIFLENPVDGAAW